MQRKFLWCALASLTAIFPLHQVAAKPTAAVAQRNPFLGVWSDYVPNSVRFPMRKHPNAASVRVTTFEISPNGRCRVTEISGRRKTETSGTYRIEGGLLMTKHIVKNTRPPGLTRGASYTAAIHTFFRFAGPNFLRSERTVTRYMDARSQAAYRIDLRREIDYRKTKPTATPFQLL